MFLTIVRNITLLGNVSREKKIFSVIHAKGSNRAFIFKPTRRFTLEEVLESIESDEPVEATPSQIRLQKILLKEVGRKKEA